MELIDAYLLRCEGAKSIRKLREERFRSYLAVPPRTRTSGPIRSGRPTRPPELPPPPPVFRSRYEEQRSDETEEEYLKRSRREELIMLHVILGSVAISAIGIGLTIVFGSV
jgi:hypothetical protein